MIELLAEIIGRVKMEETADKIDTIGNLLDELEDYGDDMRLRIAIKDAKGRVQYFRVLEVCSNYLNSERTDGVILYLEDTPTDDEPTDTD